MYSGDNMKHIRGSLVAGDVSIPVALKTLENSELYARRKAHVTVESCGSLDLARNMDDTLCDYDTVESMAFGGSSDALVLPPALQPKEDCSANNTVTAQFR
jgi:hypothetical protein